jgi:putative heme degradation protein
MTEELKAIRRAINTPAETLLRRLPDFGSLMIIGKANGVTHERIGAVERVEEKEGRLACLGECHDSVLDPAVVDAIVLDTSSVMQGQVYPRLDFLDSAGETVFAVVGFGGAEPFETVLAGFDSTELPAKAPAERPKREDVAKDDPGLAPLRAALASEQEITIAFEGAGLRQQWRGRVERVNPAMGFINVTRGDFHLHLLGGTVAFWRETIGEDEAKLIAIGRDGFATGLSLQAGSRDAFAGWEAAP